jgi:hypothetical protein
MMNVEQLFIEIEALPERDFLRLRRWFAEKDWERWERQLEVDVMEGKLDFLFEEALRAKTDGTLQDL